VVAVPPERAWDAFVREAPSWWRRDFLVLGAASRLKIDARVGGRLREEAPGGNGLLWGTVATVDRPRRFEMACDLFPAFGGPARSFVTVTFASVPAGTKVRLTDDLFGRVTPKLLGLLEKGWRSLVIDGFKPYVETRAKK
jgi:uncharacterized protein YndB with AHSA1/START domain